LKFLYTVDLQKLNYKTGTLLIHLLITSLCPPPPKNLAKNILRRETTWRIIATLPNEWFPYRASKHQGI